MADNGSPCTFSKCWIFGSVAAGALLTSAFNLEPVTCVQLGTLYPHEKILGLISAVNRGKRRQLLLLIRQIDLYYVDYLMNAVALAHLREVLSKPVPQKLQSVSLDRERLSPMTALSAATRE